MSLHTQSPQVLFEAALRDYEEQTGILLANHPLVKQLQNCDSVDSVTALLDEQLQAFSKFRGGHEIMRPLKNVVSVLNELSASTNLGQTIGMVRWKALVADPMSLTLIQ
jgi:hypothetical protein